jgi:hypothetical protein
MPLPRTAPDACPVCGAAVPRAARSCPECGADERTGWNEADTRHDGLDLPDYAFEDASAPRPRPGSAARPNFLWNLVGLALLVLMILGLVFGF